MELYYSYSQGVIRMSDGSSLGLEPRDEQAVEAILGHLVTILTEQYKEEELRSVDGLD